MHLIEEKAAQVALDAATKKWSRAYDAWEAATWVVMRDQYAGSPISESGNIRAFTFVGARSIDMPDVTILYERSDDHTKIHTALFKEAKYGFAGHA